MPTSRHFDGEIAERYYAKICVIKHKTSTKLIYFTYIFELVTEADMSGEIHLEQTQKVIKKLLRS